MVLTRPVGVFWLADERGPDAKILTVPARDPRYAAIHDLADVPAHLAAEIAHFFGIYKELEPGKSTDVRGWQDRTSRRAGNRGGVHPRPRFCGRPRRGSFLSGSVPRLAGPRCTALTSCGTRASPRRPCSSRRWAAGSCRSSLAASGSALRATGLEHGRPASQ